MTPELRDLLTALASEVRGLAMTVHTLAKALGYDDEAAHALLVADDAREAFGEWQMKTGWTE